MCARRWVQTRFVVAVAALAALVVACGDDTAVADAPVAVSINEATIPVPQIRAVLKRQPRLLDDAPETATARVVEVLVDQELAAQAAVVEGLDHDPEVAQALALATREVLARAYQEHVAAAAGEPRRAEIDRYRDSHPLLFSQRRLYMIQEFAVDATAAQAPTLDAIARRARSAEEVESMLHEAGLTHRMRRFVDAAEDVPAALLEPFAALERGQSIAVPQGPVPRIFTVLEAHAAPVERAVADEAIAAHLTAERQRRLVVPAMQALREAAQINYRGAFAKAPGVAPRPAAAASSSAS